MADLFEGVTRESALATLRARPDAREILEWMPFGAERGSIGTAILYARRHLLREAAPLLPAYLRDAPWDLAWPACVALGELGAMEALPDLLDLLRGAAAKERNLFSTAFWDPDDSPQEGAIEGVARLGLGDAGRNAPVLLDHPDEAIRRAAAAAVPELVPMLTADSPPGRIIRSWVLYALAYIGTPEAAPGARRCLADGDRHVREAAAHLLNRLGQ